MLKEFKMRCPHCKSQNTRLCPSKTALGYGQFRCRSCGKQYNERTGTGFNFIQYPTEVVMIAVHYYYRFRNSLDDVVELMVMRGFHLSHQTMHNWVQTFGVELGLKLRERRQGTAGKKWHADATYIQVEGRWCYFYRAIDKEGNLVDVYLSDVRNQAAAEAFFRQATITTGIKPIQITTDKEPALYPAIKSVFGKSTKHYDSKYKNNCIEQDHRPIKSRLRVMKGLKSIFSALTFCTAFEEIRHFFRMNNKTRSERRHLILSKIQGFNNVATITA